jgi:hypothetical protein
VSKFPFSSKVQKGLYVSHIVILLTYHQAHVKTEHKGAATSSRLFSSHTAPPCIIHLHYERVGAGFLLFSCPSIHPPLCSQEIVVFWQQCQWNQNCKVFLLIQTGKIMLNFSETPFLKRFMPIGMVSLLVFAFKSKTSESHGMIVWIASTSQMSANFFWIWNC